MKNVSRFFYKQFFSLLIFVFAFTFHTAVFAEDIDEIRELLKESYYIPIPQEILDRPTIDDILVALDPYTIYLTKEEFDLLKTSIDMNYVGIGIIGEQHEQGVKVVYIFDTGAAAQSTLQLEDIIIEVDGNSLKGKTMEEAQQLLMGSPGTTAHLKVYRPNTEETFTVDIERILTEIAPTVESAWFGGNIGYIRLNSFNEESIEKMKEAMRDVGDVKGWIIDLRDNGGGYLDAAQDVAGLFPKVDVALIIEGRDSTPLVFYANKQEEQLTGPIFLLVNAESASASEILAGAIQDQKAATLYGQKTFGKGIAQAVFELSSGNFLKMTVAQFFTPSGKQIDGIGITPDVETDIGEELVIAHRDMILLGENNIFLNDDQTQNILPRNIGIEVELEQPLDANMLKERVSLIELGGKNVDINIVPTALNRFYITSTSPLKEYTSYLLTFESSNKNYVLLFDTSATIEAKEINDTIFSDVKEEDDFKDAVTILYQEGYVNGIGDGRFGPYLPVTREQAAVFLARVLDLDTETVINPSFDDVEMDQYYYTSVAAVKKAGIMNGTSNNHFGTGQALTRGELAALLVRAFGDRSENVAMEGEEEIASLEDNPPFVDVHGTLYEEDILKCYQLGIISDETKTIFSPEKPVTRAEIVTYLYRALLLSSNENDINITSVLW